MAIAFDNSAVRTAVNSTASSVVGYVATSINPYVVVGVVLGGSVDLLTSVTFNGVNMNRLATNGTGLGSRQYIYGIAAGGTHDIVATCSTTQFIQLTVSSYSGVDQANPTDGVSTNAGSASPATSSIITTRDNDWAVSAPNADLNPANFAAGSGTTSRQTDNSNFTTAIGDSNGVIHPAGSYTMNWTFSGTHNWQMCMVALAAAGSAVVTHPLPLTGVGS